MIGQRVIRSATPAYDWGEFGHQPAVEAQPGLLIRLSEDKPVVMYDDGRVEIVGWSEITFCNPKAVEADLTRVVRIPEPDGDGEVTPWNPEPLDVDLRIVAPFDGWFAIERAEHDGQHWTEGVWPRDQWSDADYRQVLTTPERTYYKNTAYCCSSARLDKTTDIEGPIEQLPILIATIKAWQADDCKRWAIEPDSDTALVWSPRNSETSTRVTRRALVAMVAEYEARAGGAQ